MPDISPSLTREAGYVTDRGMALSSNPLNTWLTGPIFDETEHAVELRWPASVKVFDQMRTEAKVAAVTQAVMLPILRSPKRLDPNGASPAAVQLVAEDLGVPVLGSDTPTRVDRHRGRFSLREHLALAALSLVFGHMPFEQVYRIDGEGSAARARLRKLAPRMPRSLVAIDVAPDGGLLGIRQHQANGSWELIPISVDRLVFYSHAREGGAWQGRSVLRPAYGDWKLKTELKKLNYTVIRRNGMGIPTYFAPDGAGQEDINAGAALAQKWAAGEGAGAGFPYGSRLQLTGVTGTLPDALPSIQFHDQQIAESVLAGFLNLGTSKTGSRALGESFVEFFVQQLQTIAEELLDTFNEHVIEDLVDINFGPDEPAPRLVTEEVGSEHQLTYEALTALVQSGALTADPELEAYIRQSYRLPQKSTTAPAPPAPGAPASPAAARASRPRAAATANTTLRRELMPHEVQASTDFTAMQQQWQSDLDKLLGKIGPVRAAQIDTLVGQVSDLVDAGDVAGLADLDPGSDDGRALIEAAMLDAAETAASDAADEVRAQGADVATPGRKDIPTPFLSAAAGVAAQLLARDLVSSAIRSALKNLGPDTGSATVAQQVRDDLENLTDAQPTYLLGGTLSTAQNAGRVTTFDAAPDATYWASEVLDTNTCEPCAALDGTQFDSLDDARDAYASGGYHDCEGGLRCRGVIVATYEQAGQQAA